MTNGMEFASDLTGTANRLALTEYLVQGFWGWEWFYLGPKFRGLKFLGKERRWSDCFDLSGKALEAFVANSVASIQTISKQIGIIK